MTYHFQCIIKGITESPFVIWITALYPYVVLVIFFIRAIFLEGMADGILHLFKPKVNYIINKQTIFDLFWPEV